MGEREGSEPSESEHRDVGRAPGLVPFPSQVHKHHVFLVAKRIHKNRGLS